MSGEWVVGPHTGLDKSFKINGPLPLGIDNDDVPTGTVAILADRVARVLNAHWVPPMVRRCEGEEDCDRYFEDVLLEHAGATCATCGGPMGVPREASL